MEIVRVFENGIYDFRNVILPNVFDELLLADDFDEYGVEIVGALEDGKAVGAVVYRLLKNEEVFLNSFYVSQNYRRKKVATQMMEAVLSRALETFDLSSVPNHSQVPAFIHADYTLPEKELEIFESFLKKTGFTDFLDQPASYIFESANLIPKLGKYEKKDFVHNLRETLKENDEMIGEFFEEMGVNANSGLSFFGGDIDNPTIMVLVEEGNGNDFMLTSLATEEEPEDEYTIELIRAVVSEIHKKHESFTLLVSGERNTNEKMWDALSKEAGEKCMRREAGMYIIFE